MTRLLSWSIASCCLALYAHHSFASDKHHSETVVALQCASKEVFESADLERARGQFVYRIPAELPRYGDRAVAIDLDTDSALEFLVPLHCGTSGNCVWAILDDDATVLQGTIVGCLIYVRRNDAGQIDVHAVSRFSNSEGRDIQYVTTDHGFRELSSGKLKPEALAKFTKCLDESNCCQGGQQSNN